MIRFKISLNDNKHNTYRNVILSDSEESRLLISEIMDSSLSLRMTTIEIAVYLVSIRPGKIGKIGD